MSLARLVITAVTVEGRSKSAVAREYGCSRFWVHQLVNRFMAEGERAFEPHSRRPHSNPRSVGLELEDRIVRLRKTLSKRGLDAGAETIAAHLQMVRVDPVPAVSTIWRILKRRGFVTDQPQKRPHSSWKRFCADQPNERWQADLTHWRLADGSEVEILNILDDHSRVCLTSTARRITTGPQVWASFSAAFTRWGMPVEILTDNGAVFTGKQRGQGRVVLEDPVRAARDPGLPFPAVSSADLRQGGAVPPDREEVADRPTPGRHDRRAANANSTDSSPTTTPSGHTGRWVGAPPPRPTRPDPKAVPTGLTIPPHYRVRHERIDSGGSVTLRHNSRLHHIGLGARLAGTPISLLIDDLHIRVVTAIPVP